MEPAPPMPARDPSFRPTTWRSLTASLGLPLALSLALHAAAVVALTGVSFGPGGGGEPVSIGDVGLTMAELAPPPPAEVPMRDRQPEPPAPAPSADTIVTDAAALRPVIDRSPTLAPTAAAPFGSPETRPNGDLSRAIAAPARSVSFGGLTASGVRARSVVYVVDASGPMVTTLPEVFAEVQRSVAALAPTQRFGVVLFRDEGSSTRAPSVLTFNDRLLDAVDRQRARLGEFLSAVQPVGRSNPLDGLRAALAMRPQVIFLLSRSIARSGGGVWDLGEAATMAELDRLNPVDPATGRRPVVIKTIQFMERDPTGIMLRIAREHGDGDPTRDHRVLSSKDLRRP
ncbi:MAG: VWA domain-containing protein [Phycisphaeraceae bacterium]|nr:VWA domain-containing protein [Phycisphaeraceae bacterium]